MNQISEELGNWKTALVVWIEYFLGLSVDDVAQETLRRRIFVTVFSFLGAPVMMYFSWLEYLGGDWFMTPLLTGGAMLLLTCFVLVRLGRAELMLARLALAYCTIVALIPVLMDRGPHQLYYMLLIPMVAVFVFGHREGAVWGAVIFVALLFSIYPVSDYSLSTLSEARPDFIAAYLLTFAFSLGYEALRMRAQATADERNSDLETQHVNLLRAQGELERTEHRLRQYAGLASDWLFEMDADLNLVYVSPKFEQVTGRSVKDIVGRSMLDLVDYYEDCDNESHKIRLLEHRAFRDFRYSLRDPDGNKIFVMSRGEPTFDDGGNFLGYIGASSDITAYEEFQEEIRTKDRTLHHVQKLDAVGQLTSGVAHDFNNLLTVIKGNLELIRFQAREHVDSETVDALGAAANQAADLTSKLLAFSRQQPLKPDTIDIGQTLREFTQLIKHSIGETIDLNVITAQELMPCDADRSQLESAVLNLALNGRDAMSGKGKLTISARNFTIDSDPLLDPGDYIKISVIDEGKGMPGNILDKVTEPFFTTKPSGQGTGLGLSMVNGFVTQSGGKLDINSIENVGTCVEVVLPQSSWAQIHTSTSLLTEQINESPSRRVLMVEDELNVQKIVERMLVMMGHRVTVCSTAEEALEVLEDSSPDLLLTDMMLGTGMNGLELANKVRVSHPATGILLMSGYPEEILGDQIDSDFNYELLRKPFGLNDLSDRITGLFS